MSARRLLIAGCLLAALAGGAVAWVFTGRLSEPFARYAEAGQFVEIEPRDGTQTIGRKLVEAGVVRDRWLFRAALWRSGAARRLKAGEYRFDRALTPLEVVDRLARGDVYRRSVTFPEGLTIREMSRIFESRGLGAAAEFSAAATEDAALVHDLDPSARDLEGYLFPETYVVPRRVGAAGLVRMMVARFRQVFTRDVGAAAQARGLTVRQVVTLASLVEKETAVPEERPLVAGVYAHRLRIGMPLQCDPTVIYALESIGRYRGNLTRENMTVDSPYNTYRHLGLPPGPIAAPGRASLQAAANPAPGSLAYFVSRNDGSHAFARTLDEHTRNVRRYQVEFFRQKRGAASGR